MSFFQKVALALKAFSKAFKAPQEAQLFLANESRGQQDHSHLRLLTLLQHEGRLIDFLKEDISGYSDAQIGVAIRKVHADCSKCLEEFVTLRPELQESEGARITVPVGYDVHAIKVIGKVKGEPPYQGIVRHKGWRANKLSLPKKVGLLPAAIIFPAEVEIQ